MERGLEAAHRLPPDDQGPFVDLDRIRIDMLNEPPPEPAETVFAGMRAFGGCVLDRLRFFRWILHELYAGDITRWEGSLERRDERLRAVKRQPGH